MSENEVKFVAKHDEDYKITLAAQFGSQVITQGYLNENARLRKVQTGDAVGLSLRHYFTYKQRLANGENFEVETEIGSEQFREGWSMTDHRLTKDRVTIIVTPIQWDIDFYRWSQPYFVLIEAEMPPGMVRPSLMPGFITRNVVYEVPRDDGRFTARLLSDEDHVRHLAVELGLL